MGNFSFITTCWPYYVTGLKYTLIVALLSVVFGLILGIIFAPMKISKHKILRAIATCYINFIRGTPMLIQVYLIYYGLATGLPNMVAAIMALSINSGAYSAEIIRAGIESIDKGQMEAARSLGLSYLKSMRLVVLPQAIKNILPAMCNEFISTIKSTSIVSTIAIHELMYQSNIVRSISFRSLEPLLVTSLIYFTVTYILKLCVNALERRLQVSD
jgi:polar amino acid transport system permease protein